MSAAHIIANVLAAAILTGAAAEAVRTYRTPDHMRWQRRDPEGALLTVLLGLGIATLVWVLTPAIIAELQRVAS